MFKCHLLSKSKVKLYQIYINITYAFAIDRYILVLIKSFFFFSSLLLVAFEELKSDCFSTLYCKVSHLQFPRRFALVPDSSRAFILAFISLCSDESLNKTSDRSSSFYSNFLIFSSKLVFESPRVH